MLKFCYNLPHRMQQKIGHMHALGEQKIGHMHWGSGIIFATQRANHLSIKLRLLKITEGAGHYPPLPLPFFTIKIINITFLTNIIGEDLYLVLHVI